MAGRGESAGVSEHDLEAGGNVPASDGLSERELHDYLGRNTKVLDTIRDTNLLSDETKAELETAIEKFSSEFQTAEGGSLNAPGKETFEATEVEDVNQEKIVKSKR